MEQELLSLLDSILGDHKRHANSEYYWSCPFCHHHTPKLAINLNKGAWHCWVCNSSGRKLVSLFRKLDCSRQQLAELSRLLVDEWQYIDTAPAETHLALPREFKPLYEPSNLINYKLAVRYAKSRGITSHDMIRYNIGYCNEGIYSDRIIIPSYDKDGKLNYFVSRLFHEGGMKYKNPPVSKNIVCFEQHINWKYPVVLCEGVYDAIAIKRNAIPLLGKTLSKKVLAAIVEHDVREIYLALDNDAIRQTATTAEKLMLEGRTVYVVDLPEKDPNQIGFEGMQALIKSALPLTFADLIKMKVNIPQS